MATTHDDVQVIRDDRSPSQPNGRAVTRRHFRYQVQGPRAARVLEKLNGGPLPDIRFFNLDVFKIAGCDVRALFELRSRLRKLAPDLPVLFMSGYAEEQLRNEIDFEEMYFIPKPFSVQQIAARVGQVLQSRKR